MSKNLRNTPFYIHCLFQHAEADLRMFPVLVRICRIGQNNWSHVNFVTIFAEIYQIKLYGLSNNLTRLPTHLRSASGVNSDVIKIAAIAIPILKYVSQTKFLFIVFILLVLVPLQIVNRN